jgi:zinc D-Ala-D-Ala carboxypeptidase
MTKKEGTAAPGLIALNTLLIIVLFFIAGSCFAVFKKPDYQRLNILQQRLLAQVVIKWERMLNSLPEAAQPVVDYDQLLGELNFVEKSLVLKIFSSKPEELGFRGAFHSLAKPGCLVQVPQAKYILRYKTKFTAIQFCPEPVYQDYLQMMQAMQGDIGKILLIENGYRSPGRQAYDFLYYLVKNHHYSLTENARWNALPGFSEHNDRVDTALDFINQEGIDGDAAGQSAEDFAALPEYRWLTAHAHKFHFHLSYPRGNELGVTFEPWHWQWRSPN